MESIGNVYATVYLDASSITDFKLYTSLTDAMKEYFKCCVKETQWLIEDEDMRQDVSDDDGDDQIPWTCILQIYRPSPESESSELELVREFDIDEFQNLVGETEDIDVYLAFMKAALENDQIPEELLAMFT